MSRSQMREYYALLGKPGQGFAAFRAQEIERARTQVREALTHAPRNQHGKPVFYTVCRHVSRSGMRRTISLHYFDMQAGCMLHLNYAAAVLLDRPQDRLRDGVICTGCGMDMGFDLVHALACAATGDGGAIAFEWL